MLGMELLASVDAPKLPINVTLSCKFMQRFVVILPTVLNNWHFLILNRTLESRPIKSLKTPVGSLRNVISRTHIKKHP